MPVISPLKRNSVTPKQIVGGGTIAAIAYGTGIGQLPDDLLFSNNASSNRNRFDEVASHIATIYELIPDSSDVDNLTLADRSVTKEDELSAHIATLYELNKPIFAGTNITLSETADGITISASGGGGGATVVRNSASPSGSATLVSGDTSAGYDIKRLTAGLAVSLTMNSADVVFAHTDRSGVASDGTKTLSATTGKYISAILRDALGHVVGINTADLPTGGGGGGTTTTIANQGTGAQIITGSAPTYGAKTLVAGSNVTLSSTATEITISASASGGTSYSFGNTPTIALTNTSNTITANIVPHSNNERKVLQSENGVVSWGNDLQGSSGGTTYTAGNLISLASNVIAVAGSLTTSNSGDGAVTGTINLSSGTFNLNATIPAPTGGGLSTVNGTSPINVTGTGGTRTVSVDTFSTTQSGVVPASVSSAKVLRGNGWQDFPTIPADANKTLTINQNSSLIGTFNPTSANATLNLSDTTYPTYGSDTDGIINGRGLVPPGQRAIKTRFLCEDGNWSTTPMYTHPSSGVVAGSAGSSTSVPTLTVNAEGHVTALSTVAISGLLPSGTQYDVLAHNGSAWGATRNADKLNRVTIMPTTSSQYSDIPFQLYKPAIATSDKVAMLVQNDEADSDGITVVTNENSGSRRGIDTTGFSTGVKSHGLLRAGDFSTNSGTALRIQRTASSTAFRSFEFNNTPVQGATDEGTTPTIYGYIKINFNNEEKLLAIYNS